MDNPVAEIENVVRSITEPDEAKVLAENVEKYFTEDAYVEHPFVNQIRSQNGRADVAGLYAMLRLMSINNKIDFHAVMFNDDKTKCAIELTEIVTMRFNPIARFLSTRNSVRFLVRVDFKKCDDGKYRIWRQQDNFPSDLSTSGMGKLIPGLTSLNTIVKYSGGFVASKFGRFLLSTGWLDR